MGKHGPDGVITQCLWQVNFPPEVESEFYKLASINLCSNLNGQICMALVMQPPKASPVPSGSPTPHVLPMLFRHHTSGDLVRSSTGNVPAAMQRELLSSIA